MAFRRSPSRVRRALAVSSVIPVIALASEGVGQQLPGPPPAPLPDPPQAPLLAAAPGQDRIDSSYGSTPFISSGPENLRQYYPPQAKRQGVDGMVRITVRLDEAGHATDTKILSEEPTGMGFGAAASELAHQFKYAKPPSQPASVTFRIKFELDDRPGRQTGPT
jgi:protein TonB